MSLSDCPSCWQTPCACGDYQPIEEDYAPQVPTSSADYQQQRGAYADIVDEAISSYEQWLLEDDYDVHGFLKKMIERMRERRALYAAAPQPEQKG